MLYIYTKNNRKMYTIKNDYLNENGILNMRNVHTVLRKYIERKNRGFKYAL